MIEAPEALLISQQINRTIKGKKITFVSAGYTPHKFAWYYGDPVDYPDRLLQKTIGEAHAYGGLVEIDIEDVRLLFGDGMNIRYYAPGEQIPEKHQILIAFGRRKLHHGLYANVWWNMVLPCQFFRLRLYALSGRSTHQTAGNVRCFRQALFPEPYKQ